MSSDPKRPEAVNTRSITKNYDMKRIILIVSLALVTACVPTKKYNASRADAMRLEGELGAANKRIEQLSTDKANLTAEKEALIRDTTRLYNDNLFLSAKIAEMQTRYQQMLSDGSAESARMLRQIEQSQNELNERSRRVVELEALLRSREQAIENIRKKVTDALVGFEGKGLSISTRDGKVYVSMDDKLLFRSGSFDIDPKGAAAVKDLSNVLAQNPDINVMVEGHTDNVPYKPNGNLRDNLDLSTKRATTVTRLLLENNKIAPERIIAAGRGESLPVDKANTSEARQKNRRTEIILTPKIDELMQLMENIK